MNIKNLKDIISSANNFNVKVIDIDFYNITDRRIFLGHKGDHNLYILRLIVPKEEAWNDSHSVILSFQNKNDNEARWINSSIIDGDSYYFLVNNLMTANAGEGFLQFHVFFPDIESNTKKIIAKSSKISYIIEESLSLEDSESEIPVTQLTIIEELISNYENVLNDIKAVAGHARQISFAHENNESSYDDGGVYIDDATDIMKMYYVKNPYGARVGILFCVQTPGYNNASQVKIDAFGNITVRVKTKESGEANYTWKSWSPIENTDNKKTTLTGNEQSNVFYPSVKAVVDYLTANYLTASETNTSLAGKESISNRLTSSEGIDINSTDAEYPTGKAVFDFGVQILDDIDADLALKENASNRKDTLSGYESSDAYYPSTKAVADALSAKAPASTAYKFDTTTTELTFANSSPSVIYLNATVDGEKGIVITAANRVCQYFLGTGLVKIRVQNGASSFSDWQAIFEIQFNKKSSITDSNKTSTTAYPSIKAVADYLSANYEATVNRLTSSEGIDINSTDAEYPTGKAVFDFGVQILDDIDSSITQTNTALSDLKAYVGFTDGDILGLQCDFENRVFTRLGAAAGLLPGSDFNAFPMYGQRRRVVVNSDGEIQPDLDPRDITEGDTAYDVMVYQPKFYYKVVPLKLEKQSGGSGYHIRKANYYISSTPHAGFKLHPLFFDDNGNGVDYVLLSAYEASYLWDRQISTNGVLPTFFHDGVDSTATLDASAVLKSLPGVKPISGQTKPMTRANLELLAKRKSSNINGWHLDTIQSVSANQLLMAIEYASFNTQSVIGNGVVSCQNNGNNNCSSLTGSTSSLGNATGAAAKTVNDNAGTTTEFTENGKVAVSYRGMENPWGNIRKSVIGVNIWGNGTMNGGQVYICSDFNFNDLKHADNYLPCGFTISGVSGWISAFGYGSEDFDWLFMPSETNSNGANSALPVGDTAYSTANLNNHCAVHYGGHWESTLVAGGFGFVNSGVANRAYDYLGGRLLFVPKATV